jgi:hypothetical protein
MPTEKHIFHNPSISINGATLTIQDIKYLKDREFYEIVFTKGTGFQEGLTDFSQQLEASLREAYCHDEKLTSFPDGIRLSTTDGILSCISHQCKGHAPCNSAGRTYYVWGGKLKEDAKKLQESD